MVLMSSSPIWKARFPRIPKMVIPDIKLYKYDDVRNEEGAASILVGDEGESPHVAETDRGGDTGHKELSVEHSSEGLHQERQETPTSSLGAPHNLSPWAIAPSRPPP
uniref:SFRICE_003019 n=1 Tax=Spodoptera frugiperda TaxID=7108 RepID=A0A2H1VRT3_SPOFR